MPLRRTAIRIATPLFLALSIATGARADAPSPTGSALVLEVDVRNALADRTLTEAPAALAASGYQAVSECLYVTLPSELATRANFRMARALLASPIDTDASDGGFAEAARIARAFNPFPHATEGRTWTRCADLGRFDYRPAHADLIQHIVSSHPHDRSYPEPFAGAHHPFGLHGKMRHLLDVNASMSRLRRHPDITLESALAESTHVAVAGLKPRMTTTTDEIGATVRAKDLAGALLVLPSHRIDTWRFPDLKTAPAAIWIFHDKAGRFPKLAGIPHETPVVRTGASATHWRRGLDMAHGSGAACTSPCDETREILGELRDIYGISNARTVPVSSVEGLGAPPRPAPGASRDVWQRDPNWHPDITPMNVVHGPSEHPQLIPRKAAFVTAAEAIRQTALQRQISVVSGRFPRLARCLETHMAPVIDLDDRLPAGEAKAAALLEIDERVQAFRICARPDHGD